MNLEGNMNASEHINTTQCPVQTMQNECSRTWQWVCQHCESGENNDSDITHQLRAGHGSDSVWVGCSSTNQQRTSAYKGSSGGDGDVGQMDGSGCDLSDMMGNTDKNQSSNICWCVVWTWPLAWARYTLAEQPSSELSVGIIRSGPSTSATELLHCRISQCTQVHIGLVNYNQHSIV